VVNKVIRDSLPTLYAQKNKIRILAQISLSTMRHLSLLLLSLLLVLKVGAQKTFSQKDFNNFLPLTQNWKVVSSTEDHAFESWERVNDSTLQGNIYRSSDTGLCPTTYVQLTLRNRQIFLERTSLTDEESYTYTLQLNSIMKNEFLFENSEKSVQINSGNEAAKIPCYQTYLFKAKKKIDASFQWAENNGIKTIRYRFLPADN